MTKIKDIIASIESIAPLSLQEDYDNSGLQVGDAEREVTRILITLDVTEESIQEAKNVGAQLIVSHHPLLFRGLKKVTPKDYIGRTVIEAIKADIAIYSAHTNLDNAKDGVNYKIAEILGLNNIQVLEPLSPQRTCMLQPSIAEQCGSGIIGTLEKPLDETTFIRLVKERFNCPCIKHNSIGQMIQKVAVCGGAGGFLINKAIQKRADAYITGEIGYHPFIGNKEILLLEAGHYETEQYTCQLLSDIIGRTFPHLECSIAKQRFETYVTQ